MSNLYILWKLPSYKIAGERTKEKENKERQEQTALIQGFQKTIDSTAEKIRDSKEITSPWTESDIFKKIDNIADSARIELYVFFAPTIRETQNAHNDLSTAIYLSTAMAALPHYATFLEELKQPIHEETFWNKKVNQYLKEIGIKKRTIKEFMHSYDSVIKQYAA